MHDVAHLLPASGFLYFFFDYDSWEQREDYDPELAEDPRPDALNPAARALWLDVPAESLTVRCAPRGVSRFSPVPVRLALEWTMDEHVEGMDRFEDDEELYAEVVERLRKAQGIGDELAST